MKVPLDGFLGGLAQKDESLLIPFADDTSTTSREIQLFDSKGENFGGTEASGVKKFEKGAVSQAEGSFGRGGLEDTTNLICGEGGGEFAGKFGGAKSDRHAFLGASHSLKVRPKGAENGGLQPKSGGTDAARLATVGQEFAEVIGLDGGPIFAISLSIEPEGEALEQSSLNGLGAESVATLHGAGGEKVLHRAVVQLAHGLGRVGSEPVIRRQASR